MVLGEKGQPVTVNVLLSSRMGLLLAMNIVAVETFLYCCVETHLEEVEGMRLKPEEKEKQYRVLYEALYRNPRVFKKDLVNLLHTNYASVRGRLEEAYEQGWLSRPQIRLRSYKNLGEHVYFLECENPASLFSQLVDNENVVYHALMCGATNLWIVSREKLSLPCGCTVLIEGLRSDYHVSFAPNQTWDTGVKKMRKMIEEFDPEKYAPQGTIRAHWHETVEWDSEYEVLFREFNYDLSKPISPIMFKNLISWDKVDRWMKNLSTYCTTITHYYPGTISSYDPYLYVFETDYEDFLISLFSELPTSALFFRVSGRLFAYLHVKKEYARVVSSQIHITELQIPNVMINLRERGIIRDEAHWIVECFWNSDP